MFSGFSAGLKKGKVLIHTMPKSFISSSGGGKTQSKNMGLFILVGGAVLLIAVFAGLYYFISNPGENNSLLLRAPDNEKQNEVKEEGMDALKEEAEKQKAAEEAQRAEEEKLRQEAERQKAQAATSTEQIEKPATSTDANRIKIENKTDNNASTSTDNNHAEPKPKILKPAADSDTDGLSDAEEILLGTDLQSKDSDGDTYDDYSELMNFYNPAGSGELLVNDNISKYVNRTYNYQLLYPNTWKIEVLGGEDSILFQMKNSEFIQIIAERNINKFTFDEWYREQFKAAVPEERRIYKQGWTGASSEDGLIIYLMHPAQSNIFTITYNIGLQDIVNYKNLFTLIVDSLDIVD